jgi:hypothetical protein
MAKAEGDQIPLVLEYFRALRIEILEAQKLRIQVNLAKIVFLGTLLGFFLKESKGDAAILICPFVALMFDCMVYALSFNIRVQRSSGSVCSSSAARSSAVPSWAA